MFPAQTSLIPTQIALFRFIEQNGLKVMFGEYPYWYLGVPFRWLSGPILGPVVISLHKILSFLSLFELFFIIILISFLVGGLGVYLLVLKLSSSRSKSFLSAFFYLLGPFVPFLFRFSDGLSLISFSVLPYFLLSYFHFLKEGTSRKGLIFITLTSFILLLDISILPILILSMASLLLAVVGWQKAGASLKRSLFLMVISILMVTAWYSPSYWFRILSAPSLAGKGVFSIILLLGKLLPTALALTLAILSQKFFKKKDVLRDFAFYFLFIFGFLTLIRFISDPDFWLDWSSYYLEIQMGLGIGLGWILGHKMGKRTGISFIAGAFLAFYLGLFGFLTRDFLFGTFQKEISSTVEYKISKQLEEIANPPAGGNERVFLSGTTAFWFNSLVDLPQVRGGRDKVAPHPLWDQAVWEVREGEITEKALEALGNLKVSYLVIHTDLSKEFYHDFYNLKRFENLEKVFEADGDIIYKIESSSEK